MKSGAKLETVLNRALAWQPSQTFGSVLISRPTSSPRRQSEIRTLLIFQRVGARSGHGGGRRRNNDLDHRAMLPRGYVAPDQYEQFHSRTKRIAPFRVQA